MMEEERRTLLRERKRKEEKDVENEAHETQDDASNSSFSGVCALNAEINGKFILLGDDDDEKANTGGETIKPDASEKTPRWPAPAGTIKCSVPRLGVTPAKTNGYGAGSFHPLIISSVYLCASGPFMFFGRVCKS